jgi:hypothetical protein
MKPSYTIVAFLLTVGSATAAQVAPAVTSAASPRGLAVSGVVHYDLRYSQTAQFGYGQDGREWSMASGDASYMNAGKRFPFSMQYGGGYGWTWAGPSSPGNTFQSLSLSQGVNGRSWNLSATDNVSYTFQTPTTGFSGVPGTGEPIGGSGSTSTTNQTVLALNTRTLDNTAAIGLGYRLGTAWSLNTGVSSGQLRFIDSNGQDTDALSVDAGATRILTEHDSVLGQYSYSRYSYLGSGLTSQTNSAQLGFNRQWNRRFTTSAEVGPLWFSTSGIASSESTVMTNTVMLAMNASANYILRNGLASVSYFHGSNGGAGYMLGAKSDNVSGSFYREFGRNINVGITGTYVRTSALLGATFEYACSKDNVAYICLVPLDITPVTDAKYGGVQATRKLGRYVNVFANYTAIDQSSNLQVSSQNSTPGYNMNILNGLDHSLSFGIGYSPREVHLRK